MAQILESADKFFKIAMRWIFLKTIKMDKERNNLGDMETI